VGLKKRTFIDWQYLFLNIISNILIMKDKKNPKRDYCKLKLRIFANQ